MQMVDYLLNEFLYDKMLIKYTKKEDLSLKIGLDKDIDQYGQLKIEEV